MDTEIVKALLAKFQEIPKSTLSEPTFMEITSYPHLENVSTNILAFYLNPSREHGLNDLMLNALLSTIERSVEEGDFSNTTVTTEATTSSNNRLDLLIETDNFVIGIENKIYHLLNNDLKDYRDCLDYRADGRDVIPILLTLYPIEQTSELATFQPITYEGLFHHVFEQIGHYITRANHRYSIYLTDFITTIQNLRKGTKMEKEFIDFIAANEREVMRLFSEVSQLRDEMRVKLNDLKDQLKNVSEEAGFPIKQWVYRDQIQMLDILGNRLVELKDLPITVMAIIYPSGWQIELKMDARQGGRQRLQQWLDSKGILTQINPRNQEHLVYGQKFLYEENLADIQQVITELIERIRKAYT